MRLATVQNVEESWLMIMQFRVFKFNDGCYLFSMYLTVENHFDFSTCDDATDAVRFPIGVDVSNLKLLNGRLVTYYLQEI